MATSASTAPRPVVAAWVASPIAPRLIARAQARVTSIEHMEELCTGLIPHPEARTQFRRLFAEVTPEVRR